MKRGYHNQEQGVLFAASAAGRDAEVPYAPAIVPQFSADAALFYAPGGKIVLLMARIGDYAREARGAGQAFDDSPALTQAIDHPRPGACGRPT